jgi:hypothetical protein
LQVACVIPGIWSSGLSSYSIVQQPFPPATILAAPGFGALFFADGFFFADDFFFADGFFGIARPLTPGKTLRPSIIDVARLCEFHRSKTIQLLYPFKL